MTKATKIELTKVLKKFEKKGRCYVCVADNVNIFDMEVLCTHASNIETKVMFEKGIITTTYRINHKNYQIVYDIE